MCLNRLGVPEGLHEPFLAIFVSVNWEDVNGFVPITIRYMAKNLTSINKDDEDRAYNRLKKSVPKAFEWQDMQTFRIVAREILVERAQKYKTKAQYDFLLYNKIIYLINLPQEMPLKKIREAIERVFADIPVVPSVPKKKKRKRPETDAVTLIKCISNLEESTGSFDASALYAIEANPGCDMIGPFVEAASRFLRENEKTKISHNPNKIKE
jgi:hypothetical protein